MMKGKVTIESGDYSAVFEVKGTKDGMTTKLKYTPENPWQCPFESPEANFVKNISSFLAMYLKGGN